MVGPRPLMLRSSKLWIWGCVLAAVAVVGMLGAVIAVYDVRRAADDLRAEELRRLQFNAERSAGQIEIQLVEDGQPSNLTAVRDAYWLRTYWSRNLTRQPGRLYAAVIDRNGNVIAHTRREYEGHQVGEAALSSGLAPTLTRVAEVHDAALTLGRDALDVRVPILSDGQVLGSYHTGLDAEWLAGRLTDERANRMQFWTILVAGMCALLLLSSVAVVRVTLHTAKLEFELDAAHTRRVSEMHELVLGVAHEIRNPLNAIRLNLHTLGQVYRSEVQIGDEEVQAMLGEMTGEIARLENLMREMLGFVKANEGPPPPLDVGDTVQRAVAFFGPNLERRNVQVRVDLGDEPCQASIDARRLRQVLLNLLNNALEALPSGGSVEIVVRRRRGQIEISVADDGPGIRSEDRERIFVPFFSTKASGTGLGLALARKFVEEAGGTIACEERGSQRGCQFRILLPATAGVEAEIPA
jgi:two-component system, NtrC family, sensor histidine kinase HydH